MDIESLKQLAATTTGLVFLIGGAFVFFLFWFIIFTLPIRIAKNRGCSPENISSVRLLTWLGFFFGITWMIGLILACTYLPQPRARVVYRDAPAPAPADQWEITE